RSIQQGMLRDDAILTHPVFNRYHSETEMMRYMHSLERKDLALLLFINVLFASFECCIRNFITRHIIYIYPYKHGVLSIALCE
ncbi:hypothetical protein MJI37_31755, partial [Salmonella enterica subsp. enterica serovar Cerro]|nr:hypothetical protein [Salmonella enterica subsp. enterica serovar Cerro]